MGETASEERGTSTQKSVFVTVFAEERDKAWGKEGGGPLLSSPLFGWKYTIPVPVINNVVGHGQSTILW